MKIIYDIIRGNIILRYLIAGGTAASVDIIILVILKSFLHIWYITSAVLAFIVAFGVSFTLQKYWTFKDRRKNQTHRQAALYLAFALINLVVNTVLMFFFVDVVHLWYLSAQILSGLLIAIESFLIYRTFIFKEGLLQEFT